MLLFDALLPVASATVLLLQYAATVAAASAAKCMCLCVAHAVDIMGNLPSAGLKCGSSGHFRSLSEAVLQTPCMQHRPAAMSTALAHCCFPHTLQALLLAGADVAAVCLPSGGNVSFQCGIMNCPQLAATLVCVARGKTWPAMMLQCTDW